MQSDPSPDLSALPGTRVLAGASLAGLALLAVGFLGAPVLLGLLAAVLGVAAAVVVLPLVVVRLGCTLTAPRGERAATSDDGVAAPEERAVPAD